MNGMQNKVRLDVLLTERGLVESRTLAQRLVMAGQVRVDGQVVIKPAVKISPDAEVSVEHGPKYVSRGGEKLEAALSAFQLEALQGRVCADVGASTGGFTDCLLQHQAQKVYAIDVGYGELHWKLRNDPRVVVMERTNARFVSTLPETVALVTIDASFISLKIFFPVIRNWFSPEGGEAVVLIKPQFEAGREDVARGEGVIRNPEVHRQVLQKVLQAALNEGFGIKGLIRSPLLGPKGNTEFLAHLQYPHLGEPEPMLERIEAVLGIVEAEEGNSVL
jgi:23S rRNA (cytidine1920-2'-O)/16S rRNA (cytidine1409-2'-O)-methyltransferase